MGQGTNGQILIEEHFMGFNYTGGTTMSNTHDQGHLVAVASASGTITQVIDEPGGILSINLDTTDNTNCVLYTSNPFKTADGGCWMETRFKVDAVNDCAIYAGFQETVNTTTPVMPAEFATETMTYNASIGGFAGMQFDADGTTDDWRAVGGDNSAAAWDADSDATRANQPAVADKFDIVRVEFSPHGDVDVYFSGSRTNSSLVLIKHADAILTTTDVIFPVLIIENRAADAAAVLEVDYFNCGGYIDWTQ